MESSNILGAAIRAADDMLQKTALGEGISFLNESGCSLFFITSSISSMLTGRKNRQKAVNDAESDIAFNEELQRKKEQYEDGKETDEIVFKLKMKLFQRLHSREQNCLKLQDDQKTNQLEMFFNGWPLASSVAGLFDHIHSSSPFSPSLNVVLGRVQSEIEKDPISTIYKDPDGLSKGITDIVIDRLNALGFAKSRLHLMNDKCQLHGGALFANIYAVMHSLPTIVISPVVYDNQLHINVGCWNQDSSFPFQEEVLVIDYISSKAKAETSYKDDKMDEYIQALVTIAAVFNDTFLLSEGRHLEADYPHYANEHNIVKKYPHITAFALREYKSLLFDSQVDLLEDSDSAMSPASVLSSNHLKSLNLHISTIIESLNH